MGESGYQRQGILSGRPSRTLNKVAINRMCDIEVTKLNIYFADDDLSAVVS